MTEEELNEIEVRANAATMWTPDECEISKTEWDECPYYVGQGATLGNTLIQLADTGDNSTEDWMFIAYARTDIPCLIAEVRRLQAIERLAESLFTSVDTNALFVNILRRWDNDKMRRFAHMLLDRTSPGVNAEAEDAPDKPIHAQPEQDDEDELRQMDEDERLRLDLNV